MPHIPAVRVVHIASGDLWAGAEVQLYTLAKALHKNTDADVHVILMNHGTLEEKLIAERIPVTVFDESRLNAITIFFKILRELKALRPTVVHTHRQKENILGSIACLLANNIPSIRTAHGAPEHRLNWRQLAKRLIGLLDWLCGQFLQKKIIAVSEDLYDKLTQEFPARKITIVPNGIDIDALAQYAKPDQTTHTRKAFKVGLVGRLVPVKRVDLFIELARRIRDAHPELAIRFHIYGDGPLLDDLTALTQHYGLENTVHFEGHCSNIAEEMATLDALLITSDHEGLPMTLLEAMAIGTPVVARSVGGITSACHDGQCCWLTARDDAHALAQILIHCLNNHETREQKRLRAEARVRDHYSASGNAVAINQIYLDLAIIA